MTVKSESGLKLLAINILGRFLLNSDNNMRYVALNSLSSVVDDDVAAVQRHRAIILDCLKDPDVSIRQRALELTYQLVDASNIVELVRELLNYLVVAPPEHQSLLCSRVSAIVDKFAPDPRWKVETLIAMLSIAGNYCDTLIACATVSHITHTKALHGFATHKLFRLLQEELPRVQTALMHVALWCIGEFSDRLLETYGSAGCHLGDVYCAVSLSDILGLIKAVLKSHLATTLTRSYATTALMKIACRLQQGRAECQGLLGYFVTSLSLELQQRSCEYMSLFEDQCQDLQRQALARIPAIKTVPFCKSMRGETVGSCVHPVSTDLLDFDLNCKNTERRSQKHTDSLAFANDADSTHNVDLLDDIFVEKTMAAQSENAVEEPEQTQMQASFKAFEKGGLTLTMVLSKDQLDPKIMEITCNFLNHTITDFNHLVFQAAVPKYVLMELKPASAMTIPANSNWIVTQIIKVKNTVSSKPLMMRIKIQYMVGNRQIIEEAQISSFPLQ